MAVSQTAAAGAVQSVASSHSTQLPSTHTGPPGSPAQSVAPPHGTHRWVLALHAGVGLAQLSMQ